MGKYKDALYLAIWKYLKSEKRNVMLTELMLSGAAKDEWIELQQHHLKEGTSKGTGLKKVVCERPDLFILTENKGHPQISLGEVGRLHSPEDGLPDKASADALGPSGVEPGAKKIKLGTTASKWTQMAPKITPRTSLSPKIILPTSQYPKVDVLGKEEKALVRALYEALCSFPGNEAKVFLLGKDFKVNALRKESQFANIKMQDMLARYDDVFELLKDGTVRLQPAAEAALPDVDEYWEGEYGQAEFLLPDRIEEAGNLEEKMQALRIEIIRALHRRGGRGNANDFDNEFRIQHLKEGISQARKIFDFIKFFPQNFKIISQGDKEIAELVGYDVDDTTKMKEIVAQKNGVENGRAQTSGAAGGGTHKNKVLAKTPQLDSQKKKGDSSADQLKVDALKEIARRLGGVPTPPTQPPRPPSHPPPGFEEVGGPSDVKENAQKRPLNYDWKKHLTQAYSLLAKSPPSEKDVIYETSAAQSGDTTGVQAVVTVYSKGGRSLSFAGEVTETEEAAEQEAAKVALQGMFKAYYEKIPQSDANEGTGGVAKKSQGGHNDANEGTGGVAKKSQGGRNESLGAHVKGQLQKVLQKILKRSLTKADMTFHVVAHEDEYIGSLTIPTKGKFTGTKQASEKAAEWSAAEAALMALSV